MSNAACIKKIVHKKRCGFLLFRITNKYLFFFGPSKAMVKKEK